MKRTFTILLVAITTSLSSVTTFAATNIAVYNPLSYGKTSIVPEEDVILENSNDFTCRIPPPIVTSPPVVINKNTSKNESDIFAYKCGSTIVWEINGEKHKGTIVGDYVEENEGGIVKKSPISSLPSKVRDTVYGIVKPAITRYNSIPEYNSFTKNGNYIGMAVIDKTNIINAKGKCINITDVDMFQICGCPRIEYVVHGR